MYPVDILHGKILNLTNLSSGRKYLEGSAYNFQVGTFGRFPTIVSLSIINLLIESLLFLCCLKIIKVVWTHVGEEALHRLSIGNSSLRTPFFSTGRPPCDSPTSKCSAIANDRIQNFERLTRDYNMTHVTRVLD